MILRTALFIQLLAYGAGMSNFVTPVPRIPASAAESVDEATEVQLMLTRVRGFSETSKSALHAGVVVSLAGFTAVEFYSYAVDSLRRDHDPSKYLPGSFDFELRHIFLRGEKLRFELSGEPGAVARIADQLNKVLSAEGFDAEITKEQAATSSIDSFSNLRLRMSGAGSSDFEMISRGTMSFSAPDIKPVDRANLRMQLFETIGFLKSAFAANLHFDATSLESLRKFIEQLPSESMKIDSSHLSSGYGNSKQTSEDLFVVRLNSKLESMFENAYDHADAMQTIRQIKLFDKIASLGEVKFLNREVLPKKSNEPLGKKVPGKTAAELGIKSLNHQIATTTNSDEFLNPYIYEVLTKNPKGTANAIISSDKYGITAFGNGFYLSKDESFYYKEKGWVVFYEMDPTAREGVDFFIAGDNYIIVQNRDVLRVKPPSHGDYSKKSFDELLRLSLSRFLPTLSVNEDESLHPTQLTSERIFDAFENLRLRSRSLTLQEKQDYTRYIDQVESLVRESKIRTPDFYRLIFELDFEKNYLGDQIAYLRKTHTYVSIAKTYFDWLSRKYRYDLSPATREKLRAVADLLPDGKKQRALRELDAQTHQSSARVSAPVSAQTLQCIDAFGGHE